MYLWQKECHSKDPMVKKSHSIAHEKESVRTKRPNYFEIRDVC